MSQSELVNHMDSGIAIIAGTGVDEMLGVDLHRDEAVTTRFGEACVTFGELNGVPVWFLPRHGRDHSVPPSRINYRAQIAAIKHLGVRRVIGIAAVGSLRTDLTGGAFAVLGDFIDLTKRRVDTFFDDPDGPVVHTDLTTPYCPEVSSAIAGACERVSADFIRDAIYVCTEGPRYETPAEVRLYASWGAHVVGMTNVPEAVLAREAGLCYGAIAVVANLACGLSPNPLNHDEVRAEVVRAGGTLKDVLGLAIKSVPGEPACACSRGSVLRI